MDLSPQRLPISLQAKVLIAVITIMVLLVVAAAFIVNVRFTRQIERQSTQTLQAAEKVFINYRSFRSQQLISRFGNVTKEPRFMAVAQLGDPRTLNALLDELLLENDKDWAVFTSSDGQLLTFATKDPNHDSQQLEKASSSAAEDAMEGNPNTDTLMVGDRLYELVSIPVIIGQQIIGVISFAGEMDKAAAQEFKQLVNCEVVFLANGKIVTSSYGDLISDPRSIEKFHLQFGEHTGAGGQEQTAPRSYTDDSEYFFTSTGPLESLSENYNLKHVLILSYTDALTNLRATQRMLVLACLIGLAISTCVVWLLIRKLMQPLRELKKRAESIGGGDLSSRVNIQSNDEFGELAVAFNQMTENLSASRQQLQKSIKQLEAQETELRNAHDRLEEKVAERTLELQMEIDQRKVKDRELQILNEKLIATSRHAGMADVATAVLHNVGNVLNSVNLTATMLSNGIRNSRVSLLKDVVSAMDAHKQNIGEFLSEDPKGKALPGFLSKLASFHAEEKSKQLEELGTLNKNVTHIKNIIREQQRYAKVSGLIESLPIEEVVEDAISIINSSLERHHVELERDFRDLPIVEIDKHQVLQVMVNIIRNAKQSLVESNRSRKQLKVSIWKKNEESLRIEFADNGLGIDPENLQKIFSHGFTTKKDGHGFGLHSGSLDLKKMGGELDVQSEGLDQGATFTVTLPLNGEKQNSNRSGDRHSRKKQQKV